MGDGAVGYNEDMKKGVFLGIAVVLATLIGLTQVGAISKDDAKNTEIMKSLVDLQPIPVSLDKVETPKISQPQWYKDQVAAEQRIVTPAPVAGSSRTVTYTVTTKGATKSNLAEFASQANQSLNDPRGWGQLGLKFQQVSIGGSFHLILSEASQVPSFSSGCSAEWSCRVGVSVIINDDRWQSATSAWNNAGGGIRDYRHMVINHEVGHWLGHGHVSCGAPGAPAPVMLQQSIDLQGCRFNPWPLNNELWTSR